MPFISWSDKFAIGVSMIDEQHSNLFRLINDLHSQVRGGSAGSAITAALDALIEYTRYHFREEEDYMFNAGYPRFEQHKKIHDSLTQQVLEFQNDFSSGNGDPLKFMDFLQEWLTRHIMDQDKKIGKFMELKILRPISGE